MAEPKWLYSKRIKKMAPTPPAYAYIPGHWPHPSNDPKGHSYGIEPRPACALDLASWQTCTTYLDGLWLFNEGYYWEAHEAWEGIWKTTARKDIPGLYLQGLIQTSAALIKRHQGVVGGMESLSRAGLGKLRRVAETQALFCGLDLVEYIERMDHIFVGPDQSGWPADPRIRLTGMSDHH